MGIKNILDQTLVEKQQREVAFDARAKLENWTSVCHETHAVLQVLFDAGKFNTLPTEIKDTLTAWWAILKTARQGIKDNAEVGKMYDWRPET
jgi:hypothetical protein